MDKFLKATTWVFMILAVIFFWIGLRSEEDNVDYTIYALIMISIAWGINFLIKKRNS